MFTDIQYHNFIIAMLYLSHKPAIKYRIMYITIYYEVKRVAKILIRFKRVLSLKKNWKCSCIVASYAVSFLSQLLDYYHLFKIYLIM